MPATVRRPPSPDPALLDDLRAQIARLEGGGAEGARSAGLSLDGGAIDAALPAGGLPRIGLHEIRAGDTGAAAAGFAAVLAARLAGATGTVVWGRCRRGLHAPGLRAFGLDPDRLIAVFPRTETDLYWAMEEALKSGAAAAVLGEVAKAEPVHLRRLQLAAEAGGAGALLLRPFGAASAAGPAVSRWRVASAPRPAPPPFPSDQDPEETSADPFARPPARWRVDLLRCKAGAPAAWIVEWTDETNHLRVAADVPDGPAVEIPPPSPGAAPGAPPTAPGDGGQGSRRPAAGGGQ